MVVDAARRLGWAAGLRRDAAGLRRTAAKTRWPDKDIDTDIMIGGGLLPKQDGPAWPWPAGGPPPFAQWPGTAAWPWMPKFPRLNVFEDVERIRKAPHVFLVLPTGDGSIGFAQPYSFSCSTRQAELNRSLRVSGCTTSRIACDGDGCGGGDAAASGRAACGDIAACAWRVPGVSAATLMNTEVSRLWC